LRLGGVLDALGSGLVLTGGGSRLPGLTYIGESVMRRPVRLAHPSAIAKLPPALSAPEFATAVGALVYTHRSRMARELPNTNGFTARIKALFQSA
jgi:cell division protein FtsA